MQAEQKLNPELIAVARSGDREAFGRLVQATLSRTWALAWQLTGKQDDAEDLVQETYVRAFRAISRFKGEASFTSWLYRIEYNCHLDRQKKSQRGSLTLRPCNDYPDDRAPESPAVAEKAPLEYMEGQELSDLARKALDRLDPKDREVLCLRMVQDLSYQEIGHILGVPSGTVGTWLFRAREAFRQAFLRLSGEEP